MSHGQTMDNKHGITMYPTHINTNNTCDIQKQTTQTPSNTQRHKKQIQKSKFTYVSISHYDGKKCKFISSNKSITVLRGL